MWPPRISEWKSSQNKFSKLFQVRFFIIGDAGKRKTPTVWTSDLCRWQLNLLIYSIKRQRKLVSCGQWTSYFKKSQFPQFPRHHFQWPGSLPRHPIRSKTCSSIEQFVLNYVHPKTWNCRRYWLLSRASNKK